MFGWKAVRRLLMLLPVFGLLAAGCSEEQPVRLSEVRVLDGADQYALPGKAFAEPVVVELLGRPEAGLLGGSGSERPLAGRRLLAVAEQDSDLVLERGEFESDAGGIVRIPVQAGRKTGDQYLKLIPVGDERRSVTVRLTSGIAVSGERQEGAAGTMLPDPICIRVMKPDGTPAAGRRVFFELAEQPAAKSEAALSDRVAFTDDTGVAQTFLKLNDGTGRYRVDVKPEGADGQLLSRGISVEVMGLNFWSLMLNAFAGLAIFVWGMQMMSDGLQKVAGERMKGILRFFSQNRFVALLAGAGVTAVIQSSSASTVMVIGFINAGLLNLAQAVGIIIGTNIGTTITAQIVSFDVSVLAMPAIIIGLLLYFVTWKGIRGFGETVLGFGFLFFGMVIMSDELTGIGSFPSVERLFSYFDCTPADGVMPFGAVMGALAIGLIVTMIIQSSSASTGIVIALGASGLVNFYTAIPLILGANIGTTVTAQLAAITANRVAKQAALAHTLFNVFGTILMLVFFYVPWGRSGIPVFYYIVDAMTGGDAFAAIPQNVPRHIANAHTLFNVFTAIILLPFVPQLARLCEKIIPAGRRKVKYVSLDPHLLENPAIALQQSVLQLRTMVRNSWQLLDRTMHDDIFDGRIDNAKREEWSRREARIDRMQSEITGYLVQLMQRQLSPEESRLVPVVTHCTNDAERLADYAENIITQSERLLEFKQKLTKKSEKDLRTLFNRISDMAAEVIEALDGASAARAQTARKLGGEARKLADKLENNHLETLRKEDYNAPNGVIFMSLLGILRQVTERLDNIAVRTGMLVDYDLTKK